MVLLGSAVRLSASDELAFDIFGLTAGKTSRATGTVVVSARNASVQKKAVRMLPIIGVEQKMPDGKYRNVRPNINCPWDEKCCYGSLDLSFNETVSGKWDFVLWNGSAAEPGIYRFTVIERYSDEKDGYLYHGVSADFVVTE